MHPMISGAVCDMNGQRYNPGRDESRGCNQHATPFNVSWEDTADFFVAWCTGSCEGLDEKCTP